MFRLNQDCYTLVPLVGEFVKREEIKGVNRPQCYPSNIISANGGIAEFWHYNSCEEMVIKKFYNLPPNWVTLSKKAYINSPISENLIQELFLLEFKIHYKYYQIPYVTLSISSL